MHGVAGEVSTGQCPILRSATTVPAIATQVSHFYAPALRALGNFLHNLGSIGIRFLQLAWFAEFGRRPIESELHCQE